MKVSVIVPVYNVEKYLARCLDSVLAAAAAAPCETEVICVNDGSTDGSAAVLSRYAAQVRILTQSNAGLGPARNAGLKVMTGDYVLFVDSDDWIPAHSLSRFVEVATASGAALVVSAAFARDMAPPALPYVRWRRRPAQWLRGRKVQYCAWNKFYRAELFHTRRYPATIYEDFPVTTDILCAVGWIAVIDEPLYVYCTNGGETSLVRSAFDLRKLNDSFEVVRLVVEVARQQRNPQLAFFAMGQAANGHSSTVGQVWKSKDAAIRRAFLTAHAELMHACPELRSRLSLKARFRLWRMRST